MLTPDQVAQFDHTGLLQLHQAVPKDHVIAMNDALWNFLATKHDRHRDKPETWTAIARRADFRTLTRAGVFDVLRDELAPYADSILGPQGWKQPTYWGRPLVTFPSPGAEWQLPAAGWHVDSHQWSSGAVPGLVAFVFVAQVRPRGGGTLVVSGSHRMTWELSRRSGGFLRTKELKTALAAEDRWFADLWGGPTTDPDRLHRYLDRGAVIDGTEVRVVELCGEPGDVVLMNQRCLHAPAPNTGTTPRLMLAVFLDRLGDDRT